MAEEETTPAPTTEKEEGTKPFNLRDSMLGEKGKYDYGALCMPNIPFCTKPNQQVNFYGKGTTRTCIVFLCDGQRNS